MRRGRPGVLRLHCGHKPLLSPSSPPCAREAPFCYLGPAYGTPICDGHALEYRRRGWPVGEFGPDGTVVECTP